MLNRQGGKKTANPGSLVPCCFGKAAPGLAAENNLRKNDFA
jgi:hypothetical protein